jgi:hypothetical protein
MIHLILITWLLQIKVKFLRFLEPFLGLFFIIRRENSTQDLG